jgi:hypothetical protein
LLAVCVAFWGCSGKGTEGTSEAAGQPASVSAGAAANARAVPVMVRLNDGRVLAAGGSNSTVFGELAVCDVFDPATGAWTPASPMLAPREYHSLTVLADGRVLAAGGFNHVGSTYDEARSSTELFDPATGAWTAAASMAQPRYQHGAVRLPDGRVLVAGGYGQASSTVQLVSAELYDPATNTWTPTAPMPSAANDLVLLQDGRVLGGATNARVVLYDPAANEWTDAGPPPSSSFVTGPMGGALVSLADGRVLQSGGSATGVTWIWNPGTGAWTAGAPLLPERVDHRLVLASDGTVFAVGGRANNPVAFVDHYFPASNTWIAEAPLAEARATPAVTLLADGRILVYGGRSTATGTWTSLATSELIVAGPCSPQPDPCGAAGKTCGAMPDGCGGMVACGNCPAGSTCSSANVCVCAPTSCAAQGKTCGSISDGCGGTLSCGTCAAGLTCAANVCTAPAGDPVRDASLGAPRCTTSGPACDSGALLIGRGPLGPEPGAPNTLNSSSCADGTSGTFHQDESLDALRISSTDGAPLTAGRPVRIDATVWAFSASNHLDLYSAPNAAAPVWTLIATLTPASSGAQVLSTTFTLPQGTNQAIRGRFRYGGSPAPCGTGAFDDHDDLVFPVVIPPDTTPPIVNTAWPPANATVRGTVTVSAVVADDVGVASVEFLVDFQVAGTTTTSVDGYYSWNWDTTTASNGWHYLIVRARDAAGNVGEDGLVAVWLDNDKTPPTASLTAPAPGATVSGAVALSASASDDIGVVSVDFLVDGAVASTKTAAPYSWTWNTATVSNGSHQLRVRARDAAGNVGESSPISVLVNNDLTPPVVSITAPANGATVTGLVSLSASASDNVGVTSVEFRVDGVYVGSDTSAPYEALWGSDAYTTATHTVSVIARDAAGNTATASVTVLVQRQSPAPGSGIAAYDPVVRAPACTGLAASCDTGPTLVEGRGSPRELNAPNTIDSCPESSAGTFHLDESIDRVRIVSVSGASLARSTAARVEVTVFPYGAGSGDYLDVYLADVASGAPVWRYAGSATPTRSGLQTLSVPVTLSASPRQAVRAVFRYYGTQQPCPSGYYDDKDDLAFDVGP